MGGEIYKLFLVFLGGGLGSASRYGAGIAVARLSPPIDADARWGSIHPTGTMAVNLLGCLLIGLLWGRLGVAMRDEARLLLVVGFAGGFTTFSAIGWESINLLQRGRAPEAFAYIAVTILLGLGAVWGGHALGAQMTGSAA